MTYEYDWYFRIEGENGRLMASGSTTAKTLRQAMRDIGGSFNLKDPNIANLSVMRNDHRER